MRTKSALFDFSLGYRLKSDLVLYFNYINYSHLIYKNPMAMSLRILHLYYSKPKHVPTIIDKCSADPKMSSLYSI